MGAGFPIGARIVGSDHHEGGVDVAYCQRVAVRLEEAGLAWLDVSGGVGPLAIRDSPLTMGGGSAVLLDSADAVRAVVSVPVMSVGRYDTLAAAEGAVASGRTDLVAFSRALIADPDFVTKSLDGRESEVVACIACQACGCWSPAPPGRRGRCSPGQPAGVRWCAARCAARASTPKSASGSRQTECAWLAPRWVLSHSSSRPGPCSR